MLVRTVSVALLLGFAIEASPAAEEPNPIVLENQHPGTQDWLLERTVLA